MTYYHKIDRVSLFQWKESIKQIVLFILIKDKKVYLKLKHSTVQISFILNN